MRGWRRMASRRVSAARKACCSSVHCRSSGCRVSAGARCRSRTWARNARRIASICRPASACSMPVPRRASDLAAFAERQRAILAALWRLLAPDGKLLYATCSIFPQENDSVVDAFVEAEPRVERLPLADSAPAQWLPDAEHDGFYYALI